MSFAYLLCMGDLTGSFRPVVFNSSQKSQKKIDDIYHQIHVTRKIKPLISSFFFTPMLARFSLNLYKGILWFWQRLSTVFLKWTNISIFFQYIFSIKIEQKFWAHFDKKWTNIAIVKTLCKILIIWEHIYWTFRNWKKVDKNRLMATFVH